MKKLLLIGLMLAASTAAVAATHDGAVACAQAPTQAEVVAHKFGPVGALPELNCGFICDSFGRCRRVCW
ncbi:MAG: hypothetical protein IV105_19010 [Rhizobacter sp.]|nr:hypothetical protein [Rhizobacter sp.]